MMSCCTYFEATSAEGGELPQPALIPVGRVAPDPDVAVLASGLRVTALPLAPAPPLPAPAETAPLVVVLVAPLVLVAPAALGVPLVLLTPAALGVPLVPAVAAAPDVDPLPCVEPVAPRDEPVASAPPVPTLVSGDVLLEQAAATKIAAQAARGWRPRQRALVERAGVRMDPLLDSYDPLTAQLQRTLRSQLRSNCKPIS
jgi:hypothetical protein